MDELTRTFMEGENDPHIAVARMLEVFDLEQEGEDVFSGPVAKATWERVFGGQVVAQALAAAARTVPADRWPNSFHSYFLRPGNPREPIRYRISRDRDGKSFSARRIVAEQSHGVVFSASASFQCVELGYSYQAPMPEVRWPEGLEDASDVALRHFNEIAIEHRPTELRRAPFQIRWPQLPARFEGKPSEPGQYFWIRPTSTLPDNSLTHVLALAYASDLWLLSTCLLPHGKSWIRHEVQEASLDHCIWFHQIPHFDDWLLYYQDTP